MEFPNTVSRRILFEGEVAEQLKKFETEKGVSIRQIPLGWFMDKLKKEATSVSPSLIQQKVMDVAIQGAEFLDLYRKAARVVQMTSNKFEVPVFSYTDFKPVGKGMTGARAQEAGGYIDTIELDCSGKKGLYRVKIALDKTWIRDAQWDLLEDAIRAAGYQMQDAIMAAIMAKYEGDVDSNMTDTVANWGNSHYKSLMKAISLIQAEQMYPDIVLINPTEIYDLGIEDYFIHAQYTTSEMRPEQNRGIFGYIYNNNIPIYVHYKVTSGKMTVADSQKAVVLGIRQELTIENFNDIINGTEGAVLTMQFDVKSGKDASKLKPTKKAWAVVTSA